MFAHKRLDFLHLRPARDTVDVSVLRRTVPKNSAALQSKPGNSLCQVTVVAQSNKLLRREQVFSVVL